MPPVVATNKYSSSKNSIDVELSKEVIFLTCLRLSIGNRVEQKSIKKNICLEKINSLHLYQ